MTPAERFWSEEEKEILARNYLLLGAAGCMPLLPKRTREMIRSKASVMGISTKPVMTDLQRFGSKFRVTPGCWIWTAGLYSSGYGQFKATQRAWIAPRFAYTHYVGPIPSGLLVCHKCDNPLCVNPDHLFLGTDQDNASDRSAKGRSARIFGERNGQSKLTDEQVLLIRASSGSHSAIAKKFGVSSPNISLIKSGKSRSQSRAAT